MKKSQLLIFLAILLLLSTLVIAARSVKVEMPGIEIETECITTFPSEMKITITNTGDGELMLAEPKSDGRFLYGSTSVSEGREASKKRQEWAGIAEEKSLSDICKKEILQAGERAHCTTEIATYLLVKSMDRVDGRVSNWDEKSLGCDKIGTALTGDVVAETDEYLLPSEEPGLISRFFTWLKNFFFG